MLSQADKRRQEHHVVWLLANAIANTTDNLNHHVELMMLEDAIFCVSLKDSLEVTDY